MSENKRNRTDLVTLIRWIVNGSVYTTTPEKFEKAALFNSMAWLTRSILIRHGNGALHEQEEFQLTPALRFCFDGKHFENDFPGRVFLKLKSEMTSDLLHFY